MSAVVTLRSGTAEFGRCVGPPASRKTGTFAPLSSTQRQLDRLFSTSPETVAIKADAALDLLDLDISVHDQHIETDLPQRRCA